MLMHDPEGMQPKEECGLDISVKPQARPAYNIYVILLIVMYCLAHN